jgi:heme/copper-type cytochrome/quinol oxidase subunit 4
MSSNDVESIKKETRGYLVIFAGLLSLSLTAVAISYLKLPLAIAIALTLVIASIQVFLAAGYFMHLISEKRIMLYVVLILTVIFAIAVLFLPILTHHNPITGTVFHNVS